MKNEEKDPRTHTITGIAMEVHREMGPGFLEDTLFALQLYFNKVEDSLS